eukprot:scaffold389902_cov17-Prasinocladus_malaysianus.AAC.1
MGKTKQHVNNMLQSRLILQFSPQHEKTNHTCCCSDVCEQSDVDAHRIILPHMPMQIERYVKAVIMQLEKGQLCRGHPVFMSAPVNTQ